MRLSGARKILYASGSLGVALSYQAFGTYIQFLYIDILGVKASLFGIGWSLYGIWNALNDPLAGYLSDRTRTRWGRRTPWIAGAFVPLGLFFYLLWVPPSPLLSGGRALLLAVVTTVAFGLALLGIRERPAAAAEAPLALGPSLAASWRSRPFRWFLVANLHKEFIYCLLTAS